MEKFALACTTLIWELCDAVLAAMRQSMICSGGIRCIKLPVLWAADTRAEYHN